MCGRMPSVPEGDCSNDTGAIGRRLSAAAEGKTEAAAPAAAAADPFKYGCATAGTAAAAAAVGIALAAGSGGGGITAASTDAVGPADVEACTPAGNASAVEEVELADDDRSSSIDAMASMCAGASAALDAVLASSRSLGCVSSSGLT